MEVYREKAFDEMISKEIIMFYVNYISIKLGKKEIITSMKKMEAFTTKQKVGLW